MLSKNNRLNTLKEIKAVQSGKSFFLPELIVKYKKNQDKDIKAGFIVSTRIDKRATKRNLIKRRLREAVRSLLPRLVQGTSILIIARSKANGMKYQDMVKQLEFALTKLKVLK